MRLPARIVLVAAAFAAAPLQARPVVTEVEEWTVEEPGASRFVSEPVARAEQQAIAAYGPFLVLDVRRAALVGETDGGSPAVFAAMIHDYPALDTLEMLECPGTTDDAANLRLGRMIRAAGLATTVPDGGSVRSGGVELFLAGRTRAVADDAEFAVHAWEDEDGRQAGDYPAGAPENAKYLAYYREMGMSAPAARAFYALTNSVPFEDALWLTGAEMRRWSDAERLDEHLAEHLAEPRLAYLDLPALLN
jgi:hypothetical protein